MNSLYLDKISIVNYKNIIASEYDLDRKINCFVGDNGIGKTNILDSIYHLSAGKSYFNSISSQTINHDQDFMFIDGNFIKNDKQENIICSLKKGKKKTLKRNGKIYKKLSEHNNTVDYHDDKVNKVLINKKLIYSKPIKSVSNYDYTILCTAHSNLNKKYLLKKSKVIFDTRGVFADQNLKKIVKI